MLKPPQESASSMCFAAFMFASIVVNYVTSISLCFGCYAADLARETFTVMQ